MIESSVVAEELSKGLFTSRNRLIAETAPVPKKMLTQSMREQTPHTEFSYTLNHCSSFQIDVTFHLDLLYGFFFS